MFMPEIDRRLRVLMTLTSLVALATAGIGVGFPGLAVPAAPAGELPFIFGQDLLTLVASLTLLLVGRVRAGAADLFRLGVVAYLGYGYGMYAIGGLYSWPYFADLAIFGLSLFVLLTAVVGFDGAALDVGLPVGLRLAASVCLGFVVVYFAPQWIVELARIIRSGTHPVAFSFSSAVYILDLALILPLCALAAARLARRVTATGLVVGGAILVMGGWLMLSVAVGYFCQPWFGGALDGGGAVSFSLIALAFGVLGGFYLTGVRIERRPT
jgi:hypothetical protein